MKNQNKIQRWMTEIKSPKSITKDTEQIIRIYK